METKKTTFIEINRINSYNENVVVLVRTNDIVCLREKHVEPKKLFDEDGNVVSETPSPKYFEVFVETPTGYHEKYHVDETEYARLVAELNK